MRLIYCVSVWFHGHVCLEKGVSEDHGRRLCFALACFLLGPTPSSFPFAHALFDYWLLYLEKTACSLSSHFSTTRNRILLLGDTSHNCC